MKNIIKQKNQKGITLIALVITIIVLLILAGVSIATLVGENSLLVKVRQAREEHNKSTAKEEISMEVVGSFNKEGNYDKNIAKKNIVENLDKNKINMKDNQDGTLDIEYKGYNFFVDNYGKVSEAKAENTIDGVKIPKGFRHIEGIKKEEGIVVEDSLKNEYVWIPVTLKEDGTPTEPYKNTQGKLNNESEVQIQFGRYMFEVDKNGDFQNEEKKGTPVKISEMPIEYQNMFVEEEKRDNIEKNSVAKNINEFKNSVYKNGGYFIARYEAGIEGEYEFNKASMKDEFTAPNNSWTAYNVDGNNNLVFKKGKKVWDYITQNKASELCKNIENENKYVGLNSDLVNSYAWDTALIYTQICGTDSKYSVKDGVSESGKIELTGKTEIKNVKEEISNDVQCNIYDMAKNASEWSTETCTELPCLLRGGTSSVRSDYSSWRRFASVDGAREGYSFRSILYWK